MQLKDRTGISCDQCGTSHRHDFLYYSLDFKSVDVVANRRPSIDEIVNSTTVFSLDVCSACYDKLSKQIVANYSKVLSPQRRVRVDVVCDLTGKVMAGTYSYYYVVVDKAQVQSKNQPSVCVQCKTAKFEDGTPCPKCKGVKFVKPAAVKVDKRYIEFNACEEVYKTLTETSATLRKVAGEWSTTS